MSTSIRALLYSVAREELSIAGLIQGEAAKTQTLAKRMTMPFTPREAIAHQQAVAKVMGLLVEKEKVLLEKLRVILALLPDKEKAKARERDWPSLDRPFSDDLGEFEP